MDIKEILSKVDHTALSQGATWEDIKNLCDDGGNGTGKKKAGTGALL